MNAVAMGAVGAEVQHFVGNLDPELMVSFSQHYVSSLAKTSVDLCPSLVIEE